MSKIFNIFAGLLLLSVGIIEILAFPQQGQPGEGGQDSCAQYQTQCVDGSNLAGQGASSGSAIFPNNPLPVVDQVNMTAVQQMPYCDALAQACRSQNSTAPGAPTAPSAPTSPPVPEVPSTGGFFSSFRSFFHL